MVLIRLLTGFPGFLGSALVGRLLDRDDEPITCLVQARYREQARRRADALVAEAGVPRSRVRLVDGDITDPDLGLADPEGLAGEVRAVYHLAALYDLGVERAPAERVNVEGTRHVLAFADRTGVDRFHHVSTCYVSGRYDGRFTHRDLDVGQSFHNHYEATKYEAERLVREQAAAGLPATVYRPAIAVGDSATGETDKYDGPYYLLSLIRRQPRVAVVPAPARPGSVRLNVVPRDFVVDAIDALSAREDTAGEVFQLCNPHPPTIRGLARTFGRATGRRVLPVPGTVDPAYRLLSNRPTLADRFGVEPEALPYLSQPTEYDDRNTRRFLRDSGVRCPLFESYADRLVAYARDHPDVDDTPMA